MEVQRVIQVDGMECGRVDGVREEKMEEKEGRNISFYLIRKRIKQ